MGVVVLYSEGRKWVDGSSAGIGGLEGLQDYWMENNSYGYSERNGMLL